MPFAILILCRRAWRFMPASPARWRCVSGRTGRRGFWCSPSSMPPANGCAAMPSPAFPGICRPMAGAHPGGAAKRLAVRRLWPFLSHYSAGRVAGGILRAARRHGRARADDRCCSPALWVYGALRLAATPDRDCAGHVRLRLVQPDIPQNEKYVAPLCAAQLAAPARSQPARRARSPTSSGRKRRRPFLLDRSPVALDEIALLTGDGRSLITGAARAARDRRQARLLQQPLYLRPRRRSCMRSMTNSIWCRSANMCLSPICSAARHHQADGRSGRILRRRRAAHLSRCRARPTSRR